MEKEESVKLAVLEQKFADFVSVVNKIDDAIGKLSEVNVNVGKMLAVHEERIEQAMKANDILIKMIQELKSESDSRDLRLDQKIDSIESELQDEIVILTSKYEDVSRIKWITIGCGAVLTVLVTAFASLSSGILSPNRMIYIDESSHSNTTSGNEP
jgi:hypothetical protein